MTKRAERLGEFLEKDGWGVFGEYERCPKCNDTRSGKYCSVCGTKLLTEEKEQVLDLLERALVYATLSTRKK